MAVSIKISQLTDGGNVTSADYLPVARGTDTYKIPAGQFTTAAVNRGFGTGTLFINSIDTVTGRTLEFRSLSGTEGITITNVANTLVVTSSGQNPVKTALSGTGIQTTFLINGTQSINPNNYRVDIDGVLQEPLEDYTIAGSNIIFSEPPPNGSKVTVVSNNLVRAYDIIPSDSSVTTNKLVNRAVTSDKIALSGVYTENINNNAIVTSKLTTDIQYSLVPTGAIMPFYRSTAPDGWLICDGSLIPSQFISLIALVGANTPNLRGMFIRGWSPGTSTTSRDPLSATRVLGNVQEDAFESHTHPYTWTTGEAPAGTYGVGGSGITRVTNFGTTSPTGDTETRPVNISLLYCIKT